VDVRGGAWFDDITVYRLPRVELRTAALGNVLASDDGGRTWRKTAELRPMFWPSLFRCASGIYAIGTDGKLGEAGTKIQHQGSSVDRARQSGPHAHFIATDPANQFVLACDLGMDKVMVYRLDPTKLSGILLSHRHLDHSGDVNNMIEAMTMGGTEPRGVLFAPSDALVGDDPVVLKYVRPFLERVVTLEEGGLYQLGDVRFTCPVRHQHRGEVYGFLGRNGAAKTCLLNHRNIVRSISYGNALGCS
jgi:hypothetical protein